MAAQDHRARERLHRPAPLREARRAPWLALHEAPGAPLWGLPRPPAPRRELAVEPLEFWVLAGFLALVVKPYSEFFGQWLNKRAAAKTLRLLAAVDYNARRELAWPDWALARKQVMEEDLAQAPASAEDLLGELELRLQALEAEPVSLWGGLACPKPRFTTSFSRFE